MAKLRADGVLNELSALRIGETLTRFVNFAERGFVESGLAVLVREFVHACLVDRGELRRPSVSTMHVRRTSLRLFFRVLVAEGLVARDPTAGLVLPPRSAATARPLTSDEVVLCRSASSTSLSETRLPAAWALAEATARTGELSKVRVCDVDVESGRVWIHGASKTQPRWGLLNAWAAEQVRRRTAVLGSRDGSPDALLVYGGRGEPGVGQAAACASIATVLTRAGLHGEPDVRPVSVAAWAGRQILVESGRIEVVAQRLGMRNLDRAARLIGWDWTVPES